jgi:hypothetical protein
LYWPFDNLAPSIYSILTNFRLRKNGKSCLLGPVLKPGGFMKRLFSIFFILSFQSLVWAQPLAPIPINPDSQQTPGELCSEENRDFLNLRYDEKIPYCQRNVSPQLKRRIYDNYGVPRQCHRFYTIDHLIPLSMGGDNSIRNLWPEHIRVKATRQDLEESTFQRMLQGEITDAEAIAIILEAKRTLVLDLSNLEGCG